MSKESVYWAVVLDALEKLLSEETLADLVDVPTRRDLWSEVVQGSQVAAQAYYVMTVSLWSRYGAPSGKLKVGRRTPRG